MTVRKNKLLADSFFLTLFLVCLFFAFLGTRPLFVPDEGRYAEIAREMFTSGDLVTPYLNGIIYFEKPVLFYWLGAAAFKLCGLNLWSIRSVNALLGILGCLATYYTAQKLYDRKTGIVASLILGTNLLYFIMSHMVSLDLTVTFFISICLFTFLLGLQEPPGIKRRTYLYLSAGSSALAVLTKGLIGIVFPVLIVFTWIALLNQWRLLKKLYLPSCAFIFLIIVMPWHILIQLQHPDFFNFYFINQQLLRYTNPSIGHYGPIWFFVPYLLAGFFPWILFLPQAIKINLPPTWQERRHYSIQLFFLIWAILIFLFFSFSKSKLIPYILPIFPALAILTAGYVVKLNAKLVTAIVVLISYLLIFSIAVFPSFLDTRTILPFANILKPILKPQDEIITYNQYYQDLPFYLERRVTILNWRNELAHGMTQQDTHEWMIDNQTFWRRWYSKRRVFVVIGKDEYQLWQKNYPGIPFHLLASTKQNMLISNTPLDLLSH